MLQISGHSFYPAKDAKYSFSASQSLKHRRSNCKGIDSFPLKVCRSKWNPWLLLTDFICIDISIHLDILWWVEWYGVKWNKCSIPLFGYQKIKWREASTPLFGNTMEKDRMTRILNYLLSFHFILLLFVQIRGEEK